MESAIFSDPLLTTVVTKIFLEVIQDITASQVYRDVMYTLTLNIF